MYRRAAALLARAAQSSSSVRAPVQRWGAAAGSVCSWQSQWAGSSGCMPAGHQRHFSAASEEAEPAKEAAAAAEGEEEEEEEVTVYGMLA